MSVIANKVPVEVAEPQEGLYALEGYRVFPVADYLYFLQVDFYTVSTYYKPKVLCTGNIEFVLLDISLQTCLTEL